ncbi:hypothetical protein EDM52_18520 [Brevibacillus invocatus]|uniref:Uncharacterized protein n=1 Tax=Brevibacillus invocatus TaxID=173959 RepID=A0A3M8C2U1_9BACL|nr:hypothetical protein [Brevibacillus invocatus]RNB69964.1 hypothetical protein EDM52_18520 [Brevibacillus invocatus]
MSNRVKQIKSHLEEIDLSIKEISNTGKGIDDERMFCTLMQAKSTALLALVQAEEHELMMKPIVKYIDQGKVITSYHVKGFQPVKDEEGVSFFMTQGHDQQFIQMSGNVDVIEVSGIDVQAVKDRLGIGD